MVYNHTAEGDELGPTLSFRGIDNRTYYLLEGRAIEPQRRYLNYSGCGNSLNLADPAVIRPVSRDDPMPIPPRLDETGVARAAQPGPVFAVDADGFLHMRYTARSISIEWRADAATQAAVAALAKLLATPTPWTLHGRLEPGMGLACNTVLHDRSGFTETPQKRRLLYRARYHERVTPFPV